MSMLCEINIINIEPVIFLICDKYLEAFYTRFFYSLSCIKIFFVGNW